MTNHSVQIEFDEGFMSAQFVCNAPEQALCHAVWDCECESWIHDGITDGVPWHSDHDPDDPLSPSTERHAGKLDAAECCFREWFNAGGEAECLEGTITVPVNSTWQGDFYTFEIATEASHE